MNVKEKLQALLTASNNTTGETDTTLTDAVQSLIDGYGGGGQAFEYDIIEYTVTTGSSSSGTTYTIPHGLTYTPTWVVAVAVPQPTTYNQHNVAWLANEKTSGAIKQASSNGRYNFSAANCTTSEDRPITNNNSIMADSENFYLKSTNATFDALKSGDTIYAITKNMGV